MNLIKTLVVDTVRSMVIASAAVIGLGVGGYVYEEYVEPKLNEKFNREETTEE